MSFFDDDFYSTKQPKSNYFSKNNRAERQFNIRYVIISISFGIVFIGLVFLAMAIAKDKQPATTPAATAVNVIDQQKKIIDAANKVRPAVVSIVNQVSSSYSDTSEEGTDSTGETSIGSGVIFELDGSSAFIITNAHVVGDADYVKVGFNTGEQIDGELIGVDYLSDLAVIKIDAKYVTQVAEIGRSNQLQAGQFVMAVGNPLGLNDSVSLGIVSKIKRIIPVSLNNDDVYDWEQEVIQVDTSINQGNSGGPLINLDGQMVGINSMKISDFGVEGVGFAIPIDVVIPIAKDLMKYGVVKRPYLGLQTLNLADYLAQQEAATTGGSEEPDSASPADDVTEGFTDSEAAFEDRALNLPSFVDEGVIVLDSFGPAYNAGIQMNDVIVKLDDVEIADSLELRKYLYNQKKAGDQMLVTLYRNGQQLNLTVLLEESE